MKRIIVSLCAFILILGLSGCASESSDNLTMDVICDLAAEKGESLSWSDFEQYPYTETGSGLYIRVYDIDENYQLWIGGGAPDEKPMYIYLTCTGDTESRIDIRQDDINDFLEQTK